MMVGYLGGSDEFDEALAGASSEPSRQSN